MGSPVGPPGFDVRPAALRAAAGGLRDDARGLDAVRTAASEAAQTVIAVGGALGSAASDLADRIDRALGAVGHGMDDVAGQLEATATTYEVADQHGATVFDGLAPGPLGGPTPAGPPLGGPR